MGNSVSSAPSNPNLYGSLLVRSALSIYLAPQQFLNFCLRPRFSPVGFNIQADRKNFSGDPILLAIIDMDFSIHVSAKISNQLVLLICWDIAKR